MFEIKICFWKLDICLYLFLNKYLLYILCINEKIHVYFTETNSQQKNIMIIRLPKQVLMFLYVKKTNKYEGSKTVCKDLDI